MGHQGKLVGGVLPLKSREGWPRRPKLRASRTAAAKSFPAATRSITKLVVAIEHGPDRVDTAAALRVKPLQQRHTSRRRPPNSAAGSHASLARLRRRSPCWASSVLLAVTTPPPDQGRRHRLTGNLDAAQNLDHHSVPLRPPQPMGSFVSISAGPPLGA